LLSLYDLIPAAGGYLFTNDAGDQYYVYLTEYGLLDPRSPNEEAYINAFMLGFSCKRSNPHLRPHYDTKSKATILFVFKEFIDRYPGEAFVYVCDNRDGLARNRRVTFARWFNEENTAYERHHSQISYGEINWYSAILIRTGNANKQLLINAYYYTLQQMLNARNE
jgi:hypothetical protein